MVPRSAAFVNGEGKVLTAPLQPPPRTCAILLMSTSEASCHGRELPGVQPPQFARGATPQALGLQSLPDVWYAKQNPREECLL